jgi:hypothetical protein
LFERQPFERIVRCRTVANVLSIGFVVSQAIEDRRVTRIVLLSRHRMAPISVGKNRGGGVKRRRQLESRLAASR